MSKRALVEMNTPVVAGAGSALIQWIPTNFLENIFTMMFVGHTAWAFHYEAMWTFSGSCSEFHKIAHGLVCKPLTIYHPLYGLDRCVLMAKLRCRREYRRLLNEVVADIVEWNDWLTHDKVRSWMQYVNSTSYRVESIHVNSHREILGDRLCRHLTNAMCMLGARTIMARRLNLTVLPKTLGCGPYVKEVYADGNMIRSIPPSLSSSGLLKLTLTLVDVCPAERRAFIDDMTARGYTVTYMGGDTESWYFVKSAESTK